MAPRPGNPTSRDDEDQGRRSPSSGSSICGSLAEEQSLLDGDEQPVAGRHRRRSSVTSRLASMADLGGVNSFRSFARSWQRAAGFPEVLPRHPDLMFSPDQDSSDQVQYWRGLVPDTTSHTSLLGQRLEAPSPASEPPSASASASSSPASSSASGGPSAGFRGPRGQALGASPAASPSRLSSILAAPPHLAASSAMESHGSFPSSPYGAVGMVRRPSTSSSWRAHVGQGALAAAHSDEGAAAALDGGQPILVREVKQGDSVVLTVKGQSTLPQSIFNSINALVGIGLLSLPLAFKMSGWIIGLLLLTLMAAVTAHTGKLLAKCMESDASLTTYSDLAYVSFGARARAVVCALFTLELIGACVALIILFADSLDLLLPGLAGINVWKCVCAVLVLALNALPLSWLSYTSVVGIFATFCIVSIVIVDGLVKAHKPGSLWDPAATYLLPSNWLSLPLAYGLMASPWGAHSVFPSIYRDMRHPHKWKRSVDVTFSISYSLDTCLAVIGILMFGDGIKDAITSNILETPGYPKSLAILMCVCIAIIPLTKIPLSARPLITTADVICGLDRNRQPAAARRPSAFLDGCLVILVRVLVALVLLLISILFPAFDSVCAFLGAALCSLISVILPISFYLKLYWKDVSVRERTFSWLLLAFFSVLGLLGTIWTFLPKHLVGA